MHCANQSDYCRVQLFFSIIKSNWCLYVFCRPNWSNQKKINFVIKNLKQYFKGSKNLLEFLNSKYLPNGQYIDFCNLTISADHSRELFLLGTRAAQNGLYRVNSSHHYISNPAGPRSKAVGQSRGTGNQYGFVFKPLTNCFNHEDLRRRSRYYEM